MTTDVTALLKRWERLASDRRVWETLWQDLAEFVLPRKSNITISRTPGRKQTERLFDSTAIHANELLAASMQGALTSSSVKWFRLRMRQPELNQVRDVQLWLEDSADRMYAALQQSNFNSEAQEVYLDLGAFGVGALYVEEKSTGLDTGRKDSFPGLRFQALAPGEYAIAEGPDGRVTVMFRQFQMSASAAIQLWGKTNVGEKVLVVHERNPDEMLPFLHAVYPRADGKKDAALSKSMPFASVYVAIEGKHLIMEGGFRQFPYMVPRWTKASGELYGRGPGHTALPDTRTLNKAVELTLKAWAKAIDPPMKARHQGVVGNVRLQPSGITVVRDMGDLMPIEFKARFDVGTVKEGDLKTSIRDIFFNSQLQLPSGPIMTATEVERRYELMQRVLGPTLGRLESEFLAPLIERVFGMMLRADALMPPPPEVLEANKAGQADLDIEYEGPLARAQRSSDVGAIGRTLDIVTPIAQLKPDALDQLDFDEMVVHVAKTTGLPPRLLRDPRQVKQVRDERASQQAQMAQQQNATEAATAVGKMAPILKAVPPEMMQEAFGGQQPANVSGVTS